MPAEGGKRLERAEKNEEAFKGHNERRAAFEDAGHVTKTELVPFVCECDDPDCARAVEIPFGEYERAVGPRDQFVVAPGHQDPTVEKVVKECESYLVVSKPDLKRRDRHPLR